MTFIIVMLVFWGSVLVVGVIYNIVKNLEEAKRAESERLGVQDKIQQLADEIAEFVSDHYFIPTCSKCGDIRFHILGLNSIGKSVQIQCTTCKKSSWHKSEDEADGEKLLNLWNMVNDLIQSGVGGSELSLKMDFIVSRNGIQTKAPQRKSIPSKVKSEVWERDHGLCVNCGSNLNLEYDHIIPVSKGGANTARNIQLLCEPCNRTKSAKIQ